MIHAPRKQVFDAVFELLKTVKPISGDRWGMQSQRLRLWDEVPIAQQPALFLHRGPQRAEQNDTYGLTDWTWHASIWVYWRNDAVLSDEAYPAAVIDPFLDALEQTLQPIDGEKQTLGEMAGVNNVFFNGEIFMDPGVTDSQGVIVAPLTIRLGT